MKPCLMGEAWLENNSRHSCCGNSLTGFLVLPLFAHDRSTFGKFLSRLSSTSGSFLSVLSWDWLTPFYPVLCLWALKRLEGLQTVCLEGTMLSICLDTFEQPPVVALRSEFVCLDGIKCQDLQILIHGIRVSSSGNVMIPVPCHSGIKGSHWKFMFGGYPNQQNTETGHRYSVSRLCKTFVWGYMCVHIGVYMSTYACLWRSEVGVGFLP